MRLSTLDLAVLIFYFVSMIGGRLLRHSPRFKESRFLFSRR